ncbi:Olfactory receptor 14I1 [Fukomys damarensis]|uniref:Olfactory receptor 14I1 n=1 Tax=Fukomys damarensis TaxID=885580 RepID=A0A091DZK5_FUKDA|nr:Olfactory receptor 14I1 [Fukomys damarensis]
MPVLLQQSQVLDLPNLEKCTERSCERPCCLCTRSSTQAGMHSVETRKKAISTCTPQLAILLLFLISGVVAVFSPIAKMSSLKNLLTAMFYSMVPPLINPIIYCLRNREINAALQRMFKRYSQITVKGFLE